MDKNILPPRKPFTIVLRCPACGIKLQPPTRAIFDCSVRHSCGAAALSEDLSEIAEYLRAAGDGRIGRAAAQ